MCKHKNGSLIEVMDATHERQFTDGELDKVGYNDVGNIQHYVFTCSDCRKHWKFQPNTKIKWLRKIYEQLREYEAEQSVSRRVPRRGAKSSNPNQRLWLVAHAANANRSADSLTTRLSCV